MTEIEPNLHTISEDYSGAEKAKISVQGLNLVIQDVSSPSNLKHQVMDTTFQEVADVAEILLKSYGIYLDFNRAKTGNEKDWMYMLRITIPGGGPITPKQWAILDEVGEKYTQSETYTGKVQPSLRVTTRQNIQLHWVRKKDLAESVRVIAKSGFYTINGCGDNVRNVMGCPLSGYSKAFDANAWAQRAGKYFRLPTASFIEIFQIDPKYLRDDRTQDERFQYGRNLLNRKFKIAFSAVHQDPETGAYISDNCVELRTNDIGVAPILNGDMKVDRFQIYVGGSQGEKAGHPTFAALGQPIGVVTEEKLLETLDAIVKVHQEWGDRKNRHWARMKYVLYKMGMEWFRDQVKAKGVTLESANEGLDYGKRHLHQGWARQEKDGRLCYGAFLENGRIIDGPNGQLKKMIRHLVDSYPTLVLFTTPNQDLIFAGLDEDKAGFESEMKRFGYGLRNGKPYSTLRLLSGACVGRDTCRLTYTDSEKFEPFLIDELETKWGQTAESIGITGCERQCFRPATKTIGWVGTGFNLYSLKIGGTEDGRHQGGPLIDPDTHELYLHMVPRKNVFDVTTALFEFHLANAQPEEATPGGMGYFFRRVGMKGIIEFLTKDSRTAAMMKRKTKNLLPSEPALENPSLLGGGKHQHGKGLEDDQAS